MRCVPQVLPADLGGAGPDRPAAAERKRLLDEWQALGAVPAPPHPPSSAGNEEEEEEEVAEAEAGPEQAAEAPGAETRAEAGAVPAPTLVVA